MSRPLRLEHEGAVWHITARGNERKVIFRDDADRELFLHLFGEAVLRYHWLVHSYTLMDNHFHLILETPERTLSRGMQWLNSKYAQAFNRRHDRVGHLFQGRFKGILVEKQSHLLELARYVVLNPVRAGMVARPEDYKWSSYRATAGLGPAPEWLTTSWLLGQFHPTDRVEAQKHYRDFVNEAVSSTSSPWEKLAGQIYLGSAAWIEKIQTMIDEAPRSEDHPRAQRLVGRPDLDAVVDTVCTVFETTEEEIRSRRGSVEARLIAHVAWNEGLTTQREIAERFEVSSRGTVSGWITQSERELRSDDLLRGLRASVLERVRRRPLTFPIPPPRTIPTLGRRAPPG